MRVIFKALGLTLTLNELLCVVSLAGPMHFPPPFAAGVQEESSMPSLDLILERALSAASGLSANFFCPRLSFQKK